MNTRTENSRRKDEAVGDLIDALAAAGIPAQRHPGSNRLDAGAEAEVMALTDVLSVEARSIPSVEATFAAVGRRSLEAVDGVPVMVADRLSEAVRTVLERAGWGWLDRRGHLRIPLQDGLVDQALEPMAAEATNAALSSTVAMEVAALALIRGELPGIRESARALGRAPSAVSKSAAVLRTSGLLIGAEPARPELFEALAGVWRPQFVALAGVPGGADGGNQLELGAEGRGPGWALTDTLAAASWGAPIVASGAYPPDFYVPSPRALRWAVNLFGAPPGWEHRAGAVAVAPIAYVVEHRYPTPGERSRPWRLAHPLFVALDLTRDPARGREVLNAWEPTEPEGFRRVW